MYNNVYTTSSILQINAQKSSPIDCDTMPIRCITYAMASKDTQLNIRVESDLLDRLKKLADHEVTTPSQLVRKAVTLYLREHEPKES